MARRSSLSSSPLAKPSKLIHALAARVQDHIFMPDPTPLYLVMGVLVGNMMKGMPVWVMLIGPPSSGRTMVMSTLVKIPRVHSVSNIKGESAFLSGTAAKDKAKNATGGLLRVMGLRGMFLMKDFTSVLSLNFDSMKAVIGAFREIFDGQWIRTIGGEGGKSLIWGLDEPGRLGFLGASTPRIDNFHSVIQELGQRWLYFRFPDTEGFGESMAAMDMADMEATTQELRGLMSGFIEALGIDWDSLEPRKLSHEEKNRMFAMASLVVKVRSSVNRDSKTREVNDLASSEAPPRMSGCLKQLYLGLEAIGLDEAERWRIVGKVALDSAPQVKIGIVQALQGAELELRDLTAKLQCGAKSMAAMIEELRLFKIVKVNEGIVSLTSWTVAKLNEGWKSLAPRARRGEGE